MGDTPRDKTMRGLLWSHLLASVCGGLALAGVLLAFGVIGKQRTTTVPINTYGPGPVTDPGGSQPTSAGATIFDTDSLAVVFVKAAITQRVSSPFIAGTETASSTSTGSGVLIAEQHEHGYILTTYHTIQGSDFSNGITVEFNTAAALKAKVIGYDPSHDLALLEIGLKGAPTRVQPLGVGNTQAIGVGDTVWSITNPSGSERTLSSGIVSSLAGALTGSDGTTIGSAIQTDIPASPGASGGPLLDANGRVIGINDQIEVSSGGTDYLESFAVPISAASGPQGIIPAGVLKINP